MYNARAQPSLLWSAKTSLFYGGCSVWGFVKRGQAVLGSPILAVSVSAVCVCQPIDSARTACPKSVAEQSRAACTKTAAGQCMVASVCNACLCL